MLGHGSKNEFSLLYRENQQKQQTNWFAIFIYLEIQIEEKLWWPFEKG